MAHDHDHPHDHDDDHSELGEMDLRVRALETVLTQKGYIDPAALDVLIDTYQTKIGPRNGARVVAKAWVDPVFHDWLMKDATAAIASLGFTGRQGEHMVAVANTDERHHMVVCTLCSCYPWPVLGLPPTWYKSAPYRSRVVKDPPENSVTSPRTSVPASVHLPTTSRLPSTRRSPISPRQKPPPRDGPPSSCALAA